MSANEQINLTPRLLLPGGIVVFLAGAGVAALLLAPPVGNDDAMRQAAPCLFLAAAGLVAATYRLGLRVDRERGEVVRWWGFGGPWVKRSRRLSELRHVSICRDVQRRAVVHPVRLVGAEPPLLVMDGFFSADAARPLAERVAKLVGRPVSEAEDPSA